MILGVDGKPLNSEEEWQKKKTEQLKEFMSDMPKGTHHLAMGVKDDNESSMYFAMTGAAPILYLLFLDNLFQQHEKPQYLSLLNILKDITQETIDYVESLKEELVN